MQLYLAAFIVRPEWVPGILTVASLLCLVALLVPRAVLAGHDESDNSLQAFGVVAARALGVLGFIVCLIALGVHAGAPWLIPALGLAAVFYAMHRWAPAALD